ncbi:MAG: nitrilase-related carbon-nitrogen hydrolase [Planctomycetota bacterium]
MIVRAALTETRNAFADMPVRIEHLEGLRGRLDEIREANLAHHVGLVARAAGQGASVLCLGELFAAPYFALGRSELWFGLAEDAATGPSVRAMRAAAAQHGMILIAPIYELDAQSGKRFNTAVLIDENGALLGKYRKAHVPAGYNEQAAFHETFYYERSDGRLGDWPANISANPFFPVFESSAGRIAVATCYDRHFSGVMQTLAKGRAQIVFCPSVTFGAKSRRMWDLEFRVDAARHRLFIGGSNRKGKEPPWNVEYFGESHFVGPDGRVATIGEHEGLVLADLDLGELEGRDSSGWNLGRDARPDIYSA